MTYSLTFIIAALSAIVLTPVSIMLAKRWGAIDYPGGRRIHQRPIPRLGGIAIYAGFWIAVFLMGIQDSKIMGLFIGSTLLLIVGLVDDIKGLRPLVKLCWQIAAAAVLLFFGFEVNILSLPFVGDVEIPKIIGLVFILFWVVGLVNTVNISDGLDGLAAGICFGAALLLCWSAYRIGESNASHLTLALAGAALGFLFFNFHPAKVFMGDSGSMFMGYIIGGISIMGMLKTATILGLVFPLLVLAMPLTDLAFAIVRRKLRGRSIAVADRGHLHHRLLDAGLSQRQAVVFLYGMSALFGVAAVLGAIGHWFLALAIIALDLILLVTIMMRRTELFTALSRKHSK